MVNRVSPVLAGLILNQSTQGVPDPPTINSVQADSGQVTINFTAPANNHGLPVTSYYFYAAEDPTKYNTTSSSPVVVSGLTDGNSYSFYGYSINGYGRGRNSTQSASVTPGPATGSVLYTTPGSGTFTVPNNVTSISILLVGGGGGGGYLLSSQNAGSGGGGGALTYLNGYSVTPGDTYSYNVGQGGLGNLKGSDSWFLSNTFLFAGGGYPGSSTSTGTGGSVGAGGGAGGYTANGGNGGSVIGTGTTVLGGVGGAGSGSATGRVSYSGGRGGNGNTTKTNSTPYTTAGSGTGGTGGAGGAAGTTPAGGGGVWYYGSSTVDYDGFSTTAGGATSFSAVATHNGGSGGKSALTGTSTGLAGGGLYGAGGASSGYAGTIGQYRNQGANGFIRIVWGTGRAWPSTQVNSSYP